MISLRSQLIATIETYAEATGLAKASVSTRVFDDGNVIKRLLAGGDLTTGRWERSMRWLSDHWPEGADWPAGVARPVSDEAGTTHQENRT